MKKLVYTLLPSFLMILSMPAYTVQKFHGVYYNPNGLDAWACTNGWVTDGDTVACVFRSYDGGETWNLSDRPTRSDLFDIYMVSLKKGWVVGLNGDILHTTDGGNNWYRVQYGLSKYLTRIDCLVEGDTITWVAGGDGIVVKNDSIAAESTWAVIFTDLDTDFWGISFVDSLRGWTPGGRIVSEEPGGQGWILKTTDSGENWDSLMADTLVNDFMDVKFLDTLTGWVVGGDDINNIPFALRTDDGGTNWDTLDVPGYGILRGVDFINENEGWAVGEFGIIVHTVDGGYTWTPQTSGTGAHLFDVDFIDESNGIVPGDSCLILYTRDGGQNWNRADIRLYFIRGDADGSGMLTLGDGLQCFRCQFVPGWGDSCKCQDALDADDGGTISIGDCLRILRKQFVPGWQDSIPPPCCSYPTDCGPDPTSDRLGCESHPCMELMKLDRVWPRK